jgi:hypothetical protein
MGNAGQMNHSVAIMQQGFPIEWFGQVGKGGKNDVGAREGRRRSRGGDHKVSLRRQIGDEVPSYEAVATCHKHRDFVVHIVLQISANAQGAAQTSAVMHASNGLRLPYSFLPLDALSTALARLAGCTSTQVVEAAEQARKRLDLLPILIIKDTWNCYRPVPRLARLQVNRSD